LLTANEPTGARGRREVRVVRRSTMEEIARTCMHTGCTIYTLFILLKPTTHQQIQQIEAAAAAAVL